MSLLLTVILVLLVPAGLLPVVTAWFLRRYHDAPSQALRDRWHVALVMAFVGVITALLAANRLFAWGIEGEILVIPFGLSLLLIDLVSGKWLWDYWTGAFSERTGGGPETPIEQEDRMVGDERRRLQAESKDES
jgi:hypothetical protein